MINPAWAALLIPFLVFGATHLRARSGARQARLTVEYHTPPNGPARIVVHNHGPATASRVVVRVDGRWLNAEGAFHEARPTGFSRLAPDTSVELAVLDRQLGEPGPKKLQVFWRDGTSTERSLQTTIPG